MNLIRFKKDTKLRDILELKIQGTRTQNTVIAFVGYTQMKFLHNGKNMLIINMTNFVKFSLHLIFTF